MQFCKIGLIFLFSILLISCGTRKDKENANTERIRWEKTLETTGRQIFSWHVDKKCLEIGSGGTSIIVETDLDFAQAIADAMKAILLQTRTPYLNPEVAPVITHSQQGITMSIHKYPKNQNQEGDAETWKVILEWISSGKRLEISSQVGWLVTIEQIDLEFATEIADALKAEKDPTEHTAAQDIVPTVTNTRNSVNIKFWKYPQHPENQ